MKSNRRGFTLIEVIVVAAIISLLAGILVPMIFNQLDSAKEAKALAECKTISTSILMFRKDTGKWPYYVESDCNQTYTTLEGSGIQPTDSNGWQIDSNPALLSSILNLPAGQTCYKNQKVLAYLPTVNEDPWGYRYIVNVSSFAANTPVWVISAGANGCMDTSASSHKLNDSPCAGGPGDDIGIRIQ